MGVFTISHWVETTPAEVWNAYTTPELFHQFFSPDGLHIPLDSEAFRSTFRKLGRLLGIATENR